MRAEALQVSAGGALIIAVLLKSEVIECDVVWSG